MSKSLPGTHQQCKLIGITQHLLNVTILNQITYISAELTTVANYVIKIYEAVTNFRGTNCDMIQHNIKY